MAGKLIVLEGTDGSGKSTQFLRLSRRLRAEGQDFHQLVFPRYQEESSALIRLYLSGAFGSRPGDVNAYAASSFYAVDRYASYRQDWGAYYEQGGLILSETSGRTSSVGCMSMSISSSACPGRIWSAIWICPPACPSLFFGGERRPPIQRRTSMSRTATIWLSAAGVPRRRRRCWGGRRSPAPETVRCAPLRRSTRTSGRRYRPF